jgi:hypothetical protein
MVADGWHWAKTVVAKTVVVVDLARKITVTDGAQ